MVGAYRSLDVLNRAKGALFSRRRPLLPLELTLSSLANLVLLLEVCRAVHSARNTHINEIAVHFHAEVFMLSNEIRRNRGRAAGTAYIPDGISSMPLSRSGVICYETLAMVSFACR